jgi:hypothetical protein
LNRSRAAHLAIGTAALLFYEIGRVTYRPYVRAHGLHDGHIADTLGNSLGTVAAVFVTLALLGRGAAHERRLIGVVTVAMLVYEAASPLLGKAIDPWDLAATVLAGGFCIALYRAIHKGETGRAQN